MNRTKWDWIERLSIGAMVVMVILMAGTLALFFQDIEVKNRSWELRVKTIDSINLRLGRIESSLSKCEKTVEVIDL